MNEKSSHIEPPRLIAAGNLVVDAVYEITDEEFARRGFVAGGFSHCSHAELDKQLRGLTPTSAQMGGSAFNKARIAAALGIPTRIVGISGRDWPGLQEWRVEATAPGGAVSHLQDATVTARGRFAVGAHVVTPDGTWAVVTAPGSFAEFDELDPEALFAGSPPAPLTGSPPAPLTGSILTVESYLLNNFAWMERLVGAAILMGIPVHLDLGAPPLLRRFRDQLVPLIRSSVSFCSGTEEEFAALIGDSVVTDATGAGNARFLETDLLLVKRGAMGATVTARGDIPLTTEVAGSGKELSPPWSVGCGDVLDGVFLALILRGAPVDTALIDANAAAADSCRFPGAQVSAEVLSRLQARV